MVGGGWGGVGEVSQNCLSVLFLFTAWPKVHWDLISPITIVYELCMFSDELITVVIVIVKIWCWHVRCARILFYSEHFSFYFRLLECLAGGFLYYLFNVLSRTIKWCLLSYRKVHYFWSVILSEFNAVLRQEWIVHCWQWPSGLLFIITVSVLQAVILFNVPNLLNSFLVILTLWLAFLRRAYLLWKMRQRKWVGERCAKLRWIDCWKIKVIKLIV